MSSNQTAQVLRCPECNKPFDQESTLKRHGYYCRSRRREHAPRIRSCLQCAKRKARCNSGRPSCSRCLERGVECIYPAKASKSRPKIQHNHEVAIEEQKAASNPPPDSWVAGHAFNRGSDIDSALDVAFDVSDLGFANLGEQYFDWNSPELESANLFQSPPKDKDLQYLQMQSMFDVTRMMDQTDSMLPAMHSSTVSIPRAPPDFVRSLIARPETKNGSQRIANLMFNILRSYPQMLVRENTFPPFINPRLASLDTDDINMESLSNSVSLTHMIGSGVRGSRKLFWKNVRMECERFCKDFAKFNRWELLAVMQALAVYLLVRMDEGETEHNNLDFLLLNSVTVISKQLNYVATLNTFSFQTEWKEWMLEESMRRLCVVYQVVNMLVYFDPAEMCSVPGKLILAPLPAKRQLWEAPDESEWIAQNEKDADVQNDYGLTENGDLIKLEDDQLYCSQKKLRDSQSKALQTRGFESLPSSTSNWQDWCSGMDSFGGLIMLAASLTAKY